MSHPIPEEYFPPPDCWPDRIYTLPELDYPPKLNVATCLLDDHVKRGLGEHPAICVQDRVWTYGQLQEQVNRLGNALTALEVGRFDRVMLRFPNCPEFIISWLALQKIGAVAVATMPLLRARELEYIANDSQSKVLLVASGLLEEVNRAKDKFHTVKQIVVSGPAPAGCLSFAELVQGSSPQLTTVETNRNDLAMIAYTSGSTGVPKGAMHFHNDLLAVADGYARHVLNPTDRDIFGGHPSLAFTFGLGGLFLFPFRFGAATTLMGAFSPESMLAAIQQHRITILFCAATSYNMMLQVPQAETRYDLSSLRLCVSAGEPLPAPVYKEWMKRVGVELLDGIGTTEMTHIFISSMVGRVKPGATGVPVPGYEAKVVDEQMAEVPPGQPGLLALRGPTGCKYWRKPERQREYIKNGWNVPGDVYIMDEEGYFFYQCRNDDMIISAGYNIAGPEVENVLLEHPAVLESAVVASPDLVRGHLVKAFVVLNKGVEPSETLVVELQDLVKRELAPYKYPREVEFVGELPKTETGKIRRVELRQREQQKKQKG